MSSHGEETIFFPPVDVFPRQLSPHVCWCSRLSWPFALERPAPPGCVTLPYVVTEHAPFSSSPARFHLPKLAFLLPDLLRGRGFDENFTGLPPRDWISSTAEIIDNYGPTKHNQRRSQYRRQVTPRQCDYIALDRRVQSSSSGPIAHVSLLTLQRMGEWGPATIKNGTRACLRRMHSPDQKLGQRRRRHRNATVHKVIGMKTPLVQE